MKSPLIITAIIFAAGIIISNFFSAEPITFLIIAAILSIFSLIVVNPNFEISKFAPEGLRNKIRQGFCWLCKVIPGFERIKSGINKKLFSITFLSAVFFTSFSLKQNAKFVPAGDISNFISINQEIAAIKGIVISDPEEILDKIPDPVSGDFKNRFPPD